MAQVEQKCGSNHNTLSGKYCSDCGAALKVVAPTNQVKAILDSVIFTPEEAFSAYIDRCELVPGETLRETLVLLLSYLMTAADPETVEVTSAFGRIPIDKFHKLLDSLGQISFYYQEGLCTRDDVIAKCPKFYEGADVDKLFCKKVNYRNITFRMVPDKYSKRYDEMISMMGLFGWSGLQEPMVSMFRSMFG